MIRNALVIGVNFSKCRDTGRKKSAVVLYQDTDFTTALIVIWQHLMQGCCEDGEYKYKGKKSFNLSFHRQHCNEFCFKFLLLQFA